MRQSLETSHPSLPECQVSYFKIEYRCPSLLLEITWNAAVIIVLAQINYQKRSTPKMNKEPGGFAALCLRKSHAKDSGLQGPPYFTISIRSPFHYEFKISS